MTRIALFTSLVLACVTLLCAIPTQAALTSADLVGYYPFDGNGDDLGSNGAPVAIVDTSTAASSFTGTGKFGQAFDTDTDGGAFTVAGGKSDIAQDLANSPGPKLIGDDSFTLTGWFKFDAIGGQDETQNGFFIHTDDTGDVSGGYSVSMIAGLSAFGNPNQQEAFSFRSNAADVSILLDAGGNPDWQPGLWYFFAGRLTESGPTGLDVYLIPETSTFASKMSANGGGLAPSAGAALTFGRASGNGSMDGLKDDFAIWNRALTDEEIQGVFEAGLQGMSVGRLTVPEPSTITMLLIACFGAARLGLRQRVGSAS